MKSSTWGFLVALAASAGAPPVYADAPVKPQPAVQLPLEERGPCTILACDAKPPRARALIEREIFVFERLLKNAMHIDPRWRVRRHELQQELWRWHQLHVARLRSQVAAACE